MDQDKASARASDPTTAKAAAANLNATGAIPKRAAEVLRVICTYRNFKYTDGMNCKEIAEVMKVGRDSVSPRMKWLRANAYVEENGTRDSQIIYRVTPKGISAAF